jgi:hypothetical protein
MANFRLKCTWILFYLMALIVLLLNGSMKKAYWGNLWSEFKILLTKNSIYFKNRDPD